MRNPAFSTEYQFIRRGISDILKVQAPRIRINRVLLRFHKLMNEFIEKPATECCDLCKSQSPLSAYTVLPVSPGKGDISICSDCLQHLTKSGEPDTQYWRFLTETMWSEKPAVQVIAWRLLTQLKHENWAADNLDMLYMDDETLAWAKAGPETTSADEPDESHRDSLGAILASGDTVVLTRSLDVKGSNLNARMGTVVKNIRLVPDNSEQIEGKIDGQVIVILTKYLRKQKS